MVASSAEPSAVVDPGSRAERRSRRLGWWLFIVVAIMAPFALVIAGAMVAFLWWQLAHIAAVNEVKAEVARIQAAGEPITIADWYAHHRVPEGTNDITALWLAAVNSSDNQFNQIGREAHLKLPIMGGPGTDITESHLPDAEALLVSYEPTIQATLTAARARGECRYPIAFEHGEDVLLPLVQQLRGLARVLSLRARVATLRGEYDVAIDSIEANLAASRSVEHQICVIEYLVRAAIQRIAFGDINDLLAKADLTDEQLVRLRTLVQSVQPDNGLTTALWGERGVGFTSFHTFARKPATGPPSAAAGPMAGGELAKPGACAIYLDEMKAFVAASHEPLPQALRTVDQAVASLKSLTQSNNPLTRMDAWAANQAVKSETAFVVTARSQALRDLLLLAIAAKRHNRARGTDAASLEDLVPQSIASIPIDPFDGQPLRMKVTHEWLVFYSVGKDRIDNGGQEADNRGEPDIVVRLNVQPEGKEH